MQQKLGIEVKSMGSAGAMVAECGIVVTTTPSRKGYFEPEWVHSGLHITSMGSDAEDKQELKGGVFAKADLIACDLRAQSFRLGELRGAKEEGFVTDKTPVKEIGEIIRTGKSARTDKKQVTICDLTGVGVQDTMIALMAYEIAKREKAGIVVPR